MQSYKLFLKTMLYNMKKSSYLTLINILGLQIRIRHHLTAIRIRSEPTVIRHHGCNLSAFYQGRRILNKLNGYCPI